MAFTEDLGVFFDSDAFAVDATLAGVAVKGIFDAPVSTQIMGMAGSGITAGDPQFALASASVPVAVFGASLVIGAVSYTVREALPDGTGVTTLILSKA